jgi:uncharacterized membrane protein YcaP (DUF421 family)
MGKLFEDLEWKELLLGDQKWSFLFETGLRTIIMFVVIVLTLRLLGKRGVKQLSVFELGVIIGLGSAAGDPMFYKDVGLLPGILVFSTVITLYKLITFLINHFRPFEQFLEGTPTCIIKKGHFMVDNFKKEPIAIDELFSQLRLRSVAHLGQVDQAIIETNGEVSVFYYPDEQVDYGLPIIPDLCLDKLEVITMEGFYACTYCGNVQFLMPAVVHHCSHCSHKEWLKAINDKRIH